MMETLGQERERYERLKAECRACIEYGISCPNCLLIQDLNELSLKYNGVKYIEV
jgi:hypothetical protein